VKKLLLKGFDLNTVSKCSEIEPRIGDTIEKLDVCRKLWREAQIKSINPRDTPLYSSVIAEYTDKYVKYYFELLAKVGGM
jgi:hypothetical protein